MSFPAAAPGALRAGIAYFRAHKTDAEHNRKSAQTKLPMPVLTVGGTASFGADLEGEIRPVAQQMRAVMIEECGHYLAEEQPERLLGELFSFLREIACGVDPSLRFLRSSAPREAGSFRRERSV